MMEFAIVVFAIIDRFFLMRKQTKIVGVQRTDDKKSIRLILTYSSKEKIKDGALTYSLVSTKNPSAVVVKSRRLGFSTKKFNEEFIVFSNEELINELGSDIDGEWTLTIKIERSCSRINPLYKIFPVTSTHTEVLSIA